MKKIFAIIALFISVAVYGQKTYKTEREAVYGRYYNKERKEWCFCMDYVIEHNTYFTIGDYVGVSRHKTGYKIEKDGKEYPISDSYKIPTKDYMESITVEDFVTAHKKELEEKFDVVITYTKCCNDGLEIDVLTNEEINIINAKKRAEEERWKAEEQEKENRLNSLNNIL